MDIKYNIYYSTTNNGPWTLSNSTPIDHSDSNMSYFLTGLETSTRYYLRILGGFIDSNNEFVPLSTQLIGPFNFGVNPLGSLSQSSSGGSIPLSIEVVTISPSASSSSTFVHTFTIAANWFLMATNDTVENFSDDTEVEFSVVTDWNRRDMEPASGVWTDFEIGGW